MKKVTLLAAALSLLFAACKKDLDKGKKEPYIEVHALTASNANVMPQSSGVIIGSFEFIVHNTEEIFIDVIHYRITGDIPVAKLMNFRSTIKDRDSAQVYNYTGSIPNLTFYSSFTPNGMKLQKSGPYSFTIATGIADGTNGNIAVAISLVYTYFDQNGREVTMQTEFTQGQTMKVAQYSSVPQFTWIELPGIIQDTVDMPLYRFSVTSSDPAALPQFAYVNNIVDRDNNDTLGFKNLRILVEDEDSSSLVRFVGAGNAVTTTIPEGSSNLYVPKIGGQGYWKVQAQTRTFTLWGKPFGFKNGGNGGRIKLKTTAIATYQPLYITTIGSRYGLSTAASGGTVYDAGTIWGYIGQSYSALPTSSSKVHTANGLPDLPEQVLYQQ
jgi:hypothetical protein